MHLALPWRSAIQVEYHIRGQWPITQGTVRCEVTVQGPYEFLHDVTCRKIQSIHSRYRQVCLLVLYVYARLSNLIVWIHADGSAVLLGLIEKSVRNRSAPSSPSFLLFESCFLYCTRWYETLCSFLRLHLEKRVLLCVLAMKSGVPLFYLPPNENVLVNASSDFGFPQFETFWRPICVLDLGYWQRWLHSHRIGILLQHDRPMAKHLHLPSASGRYHSIQCRQVWFFIELRLFVQNDATHFSGCYSFKRRSAGFHKLRPSGESLVYWATQIRSCEREAALFLLPHSVDSETALRPPEDRLFRWNCGSHPSKGSE